jgi:hypothetical protein
LRDRRPARTSHYPGATRSAGLGRSCSRFVPVRHAAPLRQWHHRMLECTNNRLNAIVQVI